MKVGAYAKSTIKVAPQLHTACFQILAGKVVTVVLEIVIAQIEACRMVFYRFAGTVLCYGLNYFFFSVFFHNYYLLLVLLMSIFPEQFVQQVGDCREDG